MIQLVLHQPEIPQNTGSIARLCAATDTPLNLIEPLGFSLSDRYLKRAGLDYWPHVKLTVWPDWEAFLAGSGGKPMTQAARDAARQAGQGAATGTQARAMRLVFTSSGHRGIFGKPYHLFDYTGHDAIVFGSEGKGLPDALIDHQPNLVRIPIWGCVRSLNLANAASILLYEALKATDGLPGS